MKGISKSLLKSNMPRLRKKETPVVKARRPFPTQLNMQGRLDIQSRK